MSTDLEHLPPPSPKSGDLAAVAPAPVHSNHTVEAKDAETLAIDLYAMMHRALRGRYQFAFSIAAIGAMLGLIIGWFFKSPEYKSEGLVRMAYALPTVIHETDQNKPLAMFDSFLRSQQSRMTSRGLIEQALKTPTWQSTKRGAGAGVVADFADRLAVEHPPGTEHLRITFIDPDPDAAAAAVQSIVSVFAASYNEQETQLQKQRLAVLDQRRQELGEQLNTVGSRADLLSVLDSMLSDNLKRQAALETELKQLETQGYLNNHRRVAELRNMLDRTSNMIQEYSEMARRLHSADRGGAPASTNPYRRGGTAAPGRDVFRGDDRTRRDLIGFEGSLLQIQRLQADSENIRKELAETTQRMEALKVEAGLANRLEIISQGDSPLVPFRDRRALYAGAGAVAGASIPLAVLVLIGVLRPTYRSSEDVTDDLGEQLPLLGTLASLTSRFSDLALLASAAQSVHQIRVRLQMLRDRDDCRSFLISSAASGEGKTSLTTSLGLSFAASGSRVLLIDLDLVGRRLTRGFRCENREGAYEALTRLDPRGCLRETANGLWVMPSGNVDPQHVCTISSSAVRSMILHLRDAFDIVLIDTGPVLASVEASLAAPVVDGVVLAVARGQEPRRVERAINHVEVLGGRVAGVVFNRADPSEFASPTYRSSLSDTSFDRESAGPAGARSESGLKADLVVQSVMTFLPPGSITPEAQVSASSQHALPKEPVESPGSTVESLDREPQPV